MDEVSIVGRSRLRFTTRRMMGVIAVVAFLLFLYGSMPSLEDLLGDDPYNAITTTTKDWDVGPSPSITVDLFEGTIQVFPSDNAKVKAKITTVASSERSRSDAENGLKTIYLSIDHRGDSLRIVARGASEEWMMRKEAHLDLYVPSGVRLDLRTGRGEIRVGRDYVNNTAVHRPISAYSIRARNDSKYRMGYAEGNIIIESIAPPVLPGAPQAPTRLQLDAAGQIEIIADHAIVEARAWHGALPPSWAPASYEDGKEGSILFEGRLAEGSHSFRAAHQIEMRLPAETALSINAESVGGALQGDLIPKPVEPQEGISTWKGSIGPEARVNLRLRTDEGPITLRKQQ